MACGLPVVTTTDCGGADLIQDGINGHVYEGEHQDALVALLERLSDPVLPAAAAMRPHRLRVATI